MEWFDTLIDRAKNFIYGGSTAVAYANVEPERHSVEECAIKVVGEQAPDSSLFLSALSTSTGFKSFGYSDGNRSLSVDIPPMGNLRITSGYNGVSGNTRSALSVNPFTLAAQGGVSTTHPRGAREGVMATQEEVRRTYQSLQHCLVPVS